MQPSRLHRFHELMTHCVATFETFQGFGNLIFTAAGGLSHTPKIVNLHPAGHYRIVYAG